MPSVAENHPPFITFELRAEEDRDASIAAGHFIAKDVPYVLITPQGSRDQIERNAEEWLAQSEAQVKDGRLPAEWLAAFRRKYDAWKEGVEAPVEGTALANWPAISPAQLKMLQELKFRSVEELASANEEALRHLGMGGRQLKSRAQEWLSSAKDVGKQAEALSALRQEVAELREANAALHSKLLDLQPAKGSKPL